MPSDFAVSRKRSNFLTTLRSPPSPEDVASVLASSSAGILVTVCNATVFAISGANTQNFQFLVTWLVCTVVICAVMYVRSVRAAGQIISHVSRRAARRLVVFAVLLALPWSSLAFYEIAFGTAEEQVLVYLVCAGMAAGGTFMLYRTLVACLAYYATILAAIVIASFASDPATAVPILIFSAIYFGSLTYFAFGAGETARQRDASVAALSDAVCNLKKAERANYQLAHVDTVTGLPNRKTLIDQLSEKTRAFTESGRSFALLMFDLDRFKNVNDTYGHSAGDDLLTAVGERLRKVVRTGDVVARLGGDEFALLLPDMADTATLHSFAERLNDQLKLPVNVSGRSVYTSASIGVAVFPDHGDSPETLMLNADLALNKVKDTERGRCIIFDDPLRDQIVKNDWMERELRTAIQDKLIDVFYQPQLDLADGRLTGAEALVRWIHAEAGSIPPDIFLHVAAERGMLPQLSDLIAQTVKNDILTWRADGVPYPKIALNIHPVDFRSPDSLLKTISQLARDGVTARDIMLEITEGCFIGRGTDGVQFILDELVDRGFELSLDDFGTGHASLSHLKKLPVSEIKIDRSFVMGIESNQKDKSIVAATAEIARGMGIRSVAEGVETAQQKKILQDLRIDVGQGYLWAKPLTPKDFAKFIKLSTLDLRQDTPPEILRKSNMR